MKSNIRWRHKDYNTLKKEVANFNKRISYYEKKYSNFKEYLPSKVTYKTLKQSISTRNDFNKVIDYLKSLNKNTAKPILVDGKKTTIFENNIKIKSLKSINIRRANKRKEANVSTEKGTMGTIEANNLNPRKVNPETIPQKDWSKFVRTLFYQSTDKYYEDKDILYKVNFIRAAKNVFGAMSDDIINLINKINHKDLANMLFDNPLLSIDFEYGEEAVLLRFITLRDELVDYINKNNIELSEDNNFNLEAILVNNYKFDPDKVW